MPHRSRLSSIPTSRRPRSLLAVDRAVSELRRGGTVVLHAGDGRAALVLAAEAVTPTLLAAVARQARSVPALALTARRTAVLRLTDPPPAGEARTAVFVVSTAAPGGFDARGIRDLADPLSGTPAPKTARVRPAPPFGCESAAVGLAKVARLLPAAVVASLDDPEAGDRAGWAARHDLLLVDAGDVFQYEATAARTLHRVSEAEVPLLDSARTRIIAFRPLDGGLEHLAIVIGNPPADRPPLTRLHSECFTGDLLGSLRCDCGDQLRGAIAEIAAGGGGVLLYLAQEGRGIGLVNKLRAYELQDRGLDTLEANEQLGFDADERVYLPAARMLDDLGFRSVRLLTNNPDKVAALSRFGIRVDERVPHAFPSNRHNEFYLQTKKMRGGHLF